MPNDELLAKIGIFICILLIIGLSIWAYRKNTKPKQMQGYPQGQTSGQMQGYPQGQTSGQMQGYPQEYPQEYPQGYPQGYPPEQMQ